MCRCAERQGCHRAAARVAAHRATLVTTTSSGSFRARGWKRHQPASSVIAGSPGEQLRVSARAPLQRRRSPPRQQSPPHRGPTGEGNGSCPPPGDPAACHAQHRVAASHDRHCYVTGRRINPSPWTSSWPMRQVRARPEPHRLTSGRTLPGRRPPERPASALPSCGRWRGNACSCRSVHCVEIGGGSPGRSRAAVFVAGSQECPRLAWPLILVSQFGQDRDGTRRRHRAVRRPPTGRRPSFVRRRRSPRHSGMTHDPLVILPPRGGI
jgi:hypothetical protein